MPIVSFLLLVSQSTARLLRTIVVIFQHSAWIITRKTSRYSVPIVYEVIAMINDRLPVSFRFFSYFCCQPANRWERLNNVPNHSLSFSFLCSCVTLLFLYFLYKGKSSLLQRVRKGNQRT